MAHVRKTKARGGFLGTLRELVVLLLIVFIVRTFGFGLYQVPTGSMETTMLVGERFFADKFTILFWPPERKQVIAFNDPLYPYSKNKIKNLLEQYISIPFVEWGPSNWTKRVIGIPGDRVRGVIEDGKPVVYVNDQKLDEPYLNQYPLIALWPQHPDSLRQAFEVDIARLVAQGRLKSEDAEMYLASCIERSLSWRPYDAQYSFAEQPFYRMNQNLVFRVPQDQGIEEAGYRTRDGMVFKEPFTPRPLQDGSLGAMGTGKSHWNGTDEFYVELKEHEYWLMGDNRRGSMDCRVFGPVHDRLIHGKIVFRIWSSDSTESWWIFDLIKHPIDFWKRMRWCRFFQIIR